MNVLKLFKKEKKAAEDVNKMQSDLIKKYDKLISAVKFVSFPIGNMSIHFVHRKVNRNGLQ